MPDSLSAMFESIMLDPNANGQLPLLSFDETFHGLEDTLIEWSNNTINTSQTSTTISQGMAYSSLGGVYPNQAENESTTLFIDEDVICYGMVSPHFN